MTGLTVQQLATSTWPDFADLVERNGGVWGGCWCMAFHPEGLGPGKSAAQNQIEKECRVREGAAHATLVYNAARCVGWCQFGSPDELPNIKSKRAYDSGMVTLPDWRITCLFVGKGHRRHGVADAALAGTLDEIARLGGGTVESYPEDVAGRKVSASFLHNGTLALFERHGFESSCKIGKHRWVVSKVVAPAAAAVGS